ncbi:alginate O-acetyltransferase complex protein AlgI [Lysinibacillus composti]|uniref:MBOAT family protein n=1 Tax=Lysinibacillus composti TaxID=720633 RepID=A0A3N9UH62_9BACI|nr:MBOAT family O-acyltransferase [Lysinibacillus composti]MBM7609086.1 alginate O-acetyltransferase complex protein AlgI [Lysinibacillus composti]RQW75493.1 MBOAT family protein [Lysinibacillus composti]
MVFSSLLFLYVFLPIVIILYFISPKVLRNSILLIASLLFYAWGEPKYVVLMLISIFINYVFGIVMDKAQQKSKRLTFLWITVILNLAILGYYKYAGFFIDIFADLTGKEIEWEAVPLPIGISFYTFQAISYIIDVYRKEVPAQRSLIDLSLFITLFPQLVAGPIVRYQTVNEEIKKRFTSSSDLMIGTRRFIQGLGKKVLIANPMGEVADQIFAISGGDLTTGTAWIGIIAYSLQIYFDFSGYSDMAIGLARIFGFKFEENFNYPYIAQSVSEFWRRWHISLSSWFRDYVYFPLGGSRVSHEWKVYRNLLVVWTLTGFWHGASWTFMAWGFYFGILISLEKKFLLKWLNKIPRVFRHIYVLFIVMIGWVFFRADNFSYAFDYLKAMFFMTDAATFDYNTLLYMKDYSIYFIAAFILSMPIYIMYQKWSESKAEKSIAFAAPLRIWQTVFYIALILVITMYLVNATHNPFIYFRF